MVKSGRRGKGFPPGKPATLFDPAVAAAVDGDDDHEAPCDRGRVESISGIGPNDYVSGSFIIKR